MTPLFRRSLVLAGLSGLAALGAWRACRSLERAARAPAEGLREAGRAAAEIAERFRSGRITTTFTAALPRLVAGGPLLEVGSFEADETVRRTDERALFFDLVPLGTNVTEIRVPVTYRYHVVLADPWRLDVRDHVCLVRAPRLRASLPPAIHTDRMEKRSSRGWARWDVERQMDELERGLTPLLSLRARSPAQMALVREPCRRRVAEFVRAWLLGEEQWREGGFGGVSVVFEDEGDGAALGTPTLVRE